MTIPEEIVSQLMEMDVDRRRQFLSELVQDSSEDLTNALGKALVQSNWPVCDEVADALVGRHAELTHIWAKPAWALDPPAAMAERL